MKHGFENVMRMARLNTTKSRPAAICYTSWRDVQMQCPLVDATDHVEIMTKRMETTGISGFPARRCALLNKMTRMFAAPNTAGAIADSLIEAT